MHGETRGQHVHFNMFLLLLLCTNIHLCLPSLAPQPHVTIEHLSLVHMLLFLFIHISTLRPYDMVKFMSSLSIIHTTSYNPMLLPRAHCGLDRPRSICLMKADPIFPLWLGLRLLMMMAFSERL